jgi:hypothetical protein
MRSYALIDLTDRHLHMRKITMSSLSASVPVQRLRPESLYILTRWNSSERPVPTTELLNKHTEVITTSIMLELGTVG